MPLQKDEFGQYVAHLTPEELVYIKARIYGRGEDDADRVIETLEHAFEVIKEKDRVIHNMQARVAKMGACALKEGYVGVPETAVNEAIEVLWLYREMLLAQTLQSAINDSRTGRSELPAEQDDAA